MTARRVVRERIDPRLTALFSDCLARLDAILELVDSAGGQPRAGAAGS